MKCRVSIPKLKLSAFTVILPKFYCPSCLTDAGIIVPFRQSSNLKVHIGYAHTAYEQRSFVCNNCDKRFVTKQDLGYHETKKVCHTGKIIKEMK